MNRDRSRDSNKRAHTITQQAPLSSWVGVCLCDCSMQKYHQGSPTTFDIGDSVYLCSLSQSCQHFFRRSFYRSCHASPVRHIFHTSSNNPDARLRRIQLPKRAKDRTCPQEASILLNLRMASQFGAWLPRAASLVGLLLNFMHFFLRMAHSSPLVTDELNNRIHLWRFTCGNHLGHANVSEFLRID